jgi:NAD(P)-dependent dehydrogenase (short-subunit alcohol dehydrogenase family)
MSGDPLFDVDRRVVVVTGGMGRLGRRFALALRQRGARVVVLDVAVDDATVAHRYGDDREGLLFVEGDVTSAASLGGALATIEKAWGPPHALINNAAIDAPPDAPPQENGPFESYPEESWDRVMAVNVKGVFLCARTFGAAMAGAKRGSIVNIASIYGVVSPDQRIYDYRRQAGEPFFKPIAYGASKASLLNMTRYLATYWASSGVRVNTLTLGGVFSQQDDRFVAAYSQRVPLGRMARESEYDAAVIFLVSDASSYMTGSNMIVDGGWTAW